MRLFIIILLTVLQNLCSNSQGVQVKISASSSVRINNSIRAESKTFTVPVFYSQNGNDSSEKKEQYENGSKNIEDQLDPWIRQSIMNATKQMANRNKYMKNLGQNINKKARKIQVQYKNFDIPQTKMRGRRGRIAPPSIPRGVKRLPKDKYSPNVSAASPSSSSQTSKKQQKQNQSQQSNSSGVVLNLETDLNFGSDNQFNQVQVSDQQKNFQ